jgi:hypothetical protein
MELLGGLHIRWTDRKASDGLETADGAKQPATCNYEGYSLREDELNVNITLSPDAIKPANCSL